MRFASARAWCAGSASPAQRRSLARGTKIPSWTFLFPLPLTHTQQCEVMGGENATRCPVTSHTLISILQNRDDPLTEVQGGDEQPAGTRPSTHGLLFWCAIGRGGVTGRDAVSPITRDTLSLGARR